MNDHSPAPPNIGSRRVVEWQIALWSIFLAAFAGAGALPLRSITLQNRVMKQGANSSTDTIFARDLALEDATPKILELLSAVPVDAKVAVVWRARSSDSLPACLIQQLAWPRPVVGIPAPELAGGGENTLAQAIHDSEAQAVFFLRSTPPSSLHALDLSPLVQFRRLP
jgi:hypothetical protein